MSDDLDSFMDGLTVTTMEATAGCFTVVCVLFALFWLVGIAVAVVRWVG